MVITRQVVADRISAYLQGRQELADLVSWAEEAMREGEFDEVHFNTIREVVARLGLAHVAAFGLTWEDAVEMLSRLGLPALLGFGRKCPDIFVTALDPTLDLDG
jgi:hypothetical protein